MYCPALQDLSVIQQQSGRRQQYLHVHSTGMHRGPAGYCIQVPARPDAAARYAKDVRDQALQCG